MYTLLQRTSSLLDALKFHAVLEGQVNVVLHHKLHAVNLKCDGCKLVNLIQVVILLADLLQQGATGLVQRSILGISGLVASFCHKLKRIKV